MRPLEKVRGNQYTSRMHVRAYMDISLRRRICCLGRILLQSPLLEEALYHRKHVERQL
jgi:hypothetical protein